MNLKLLIFKARSKGVPVYCCFIFLVYLVLKHFYSTPPLRSRAPEVIGYLKFKKPSSLPVNTLTSADLSRLSSTIDMLNYEREVLMAWRYGGVSVDTNMIVVQVHRDLERLQLLILSLSRVRYIQTALLVFSHSYYDDHINKLVSSITFCRVTQIFYPYSLQLYPSRFPGIDPEDCLSDIGKTNCSDRDARLTEHKHHWWWKASFIFNEFDWSDGYKGTVIFLQEDSYVLPDLLYMLRYTMRSKAYLQGIYVMSFGRPYAKGLDYDLLTVTAWRPPYDGGLAFNKTVWLKISGMSMYYCMYDDLSWSYSLLNAFDKFPDRHADMVAVMAPRVLTTGMFSSGRTALDQFSLWVDDAELFPPKVKVVMLYSSYGRVEKWVKPPPFGNGGWSDLRDHLLCLDPLITPMGNPRKSIPSTPAAEMDYITNYSANVSETVVRSIL